MLKFVLGIILVSISCTAPTLPTPTATPVVTATTLSFISNNTFGGGGGSLLPYGDYLLVSRNPSSQLLAGYATSDGVVRWTRVVYPSDSPGNNYGVNFYQLPNRAIVAYGGEWVIGGGGISKGHIILSFNSSDGSLLTSKKLDAAGYVSGNLLVADDYLTWCATGTATGTGLTAYLYVFDHALNLLRTISTRSSTLKHAFSWGSTLQSPAEDVVYQCIYLGPVPGDESVAVIKVNVTSGQRLWVNGWTDGGDAGWRTCTIAYLSAGFVIAASYAYSGGTKVALLMLLDSTTGAVFSTLTGPYTSISLSSLGSGLAVAYYIDSSHVCVRLLLRADAGTGIIVEESHRIDAFQFQSVYRSAEGALYMKGTLASNPLQTVLVRAENISYTEAACLPVTAISNPLSSVTPRPLTVTLNTALRTITPASLNTAVPAVTNYEFNFSSSCATVTTTPSASPSPSGFRTASSSRSVSDTPSSTATPSPRVVTPSSTATPSPRVVTPSSTATPSPRVVTPSSTATPSPRVVTPSSTATPEWTLTASVSKTSHRATMSHSFTVTPTYLATPTRSLSPVMTATTSLSHTPSPTPLSTESVNVDRLWPAVVPLAQSISPNAVIAPDITSPLLPQTFPVFSPRRVSAAEFPAALLASLFPSTSPFRAAPLVAPSPLVLPAVLPAVASNPSGGPLFPGRDGRFDTVSLVPAAIRKILPSLPPSPARVGAEITALRPLFGGPPHVIPADFPLVDAILKDLSHPTPQSTTWGNVSETLINSGLFPKYVRRDVSTVEAIGKVLSNPKERRAIAFASATIVAQVPPLVVASLISDVKCTSANLQSLDPIGENLEGSIASAAGAQDVSSQLLLSLWLYGGLFCVALVVWALAKLFIFCVKKEGRCITWFLNRLELMDSFRTIWWYIHLVFTVVFLERLAQIFFCLPLKAFPPYILVIASVLFIIFVPLDIAVAVCTVVAMSKGAVFVPTVPYPVIQNTKWWKRGLRGCGEWMDLPNMSRCSPFSYPARRYGLLFEDLQPTLSARIFVLVQSLERICVGGVFGTSCLSCCPMFSMLVGIFAFTSMYVFLFRPFTSELQNYLRIYSSLVLLTAACILQIMGCGADVGDTTTIATYVVGAGIGLQLLVIFILYVYRLRSTLRARKFVRHDIVGRMTSVAVLAKARHARVSEWDLYEALCRRRQKMRASGCYDGFHFKDFSRGVLAKKGWPVQMNAFLLASVASMERDINPRYHVRIGSLPPFQWPDGLSFNFKDLTAYASTYAGPLTKFVDFSVDRDSGLVKRTFDLEAAAADEDSWFAKPFDDEATVAFENVSEPSPDQEDEKPKVSRSQIRFQDWLRTASSSSAWSRSGMSQSFSPDPVATPGSRLIDIKPGVPSPMHRLRGLPQSGSQFLLHFG